MSRARILLVALCLIFPFTVFSQTNAPSKGIPFKVLSHGRLSGTYQAFPDICRSKSGELLCVFYAGYSYISLPAPDFVKGGRICVVRSDDDGQSWGDPTILYDDANDNRDPHIALLPDGSLACSFFSFAPKGDRIRWTPELKKPFNELVSLVGVQLVSSKTGGESWSPNAKIIASGWACSAHQP